MKMKKIKTFKRTSYVLIGIIGRNIISTALLENTG